MPIVAPATPEQNVPDWRTDVGLAVAATLTLSANVFERWHAYRLFDKCFLSFSCSVFSRFRGKVFG